jgi:hypothetical protein
MTPEFTTKEALEIALEVLRDRAAETDTASSEGWKVRGAIEALERVHVQKGCEHLDPAVGDGLLTTLCDIVIYG